MASDLGTGDVETPWVDVAPADAGTTVTLVVTKPDLTTDTVTMVAGDLVEIAGTSPTEYSCRFTADTPVVYSQAGRWVLHYEVAGTGEGAEDLEVFVVPSPVAGGPMWLPGRSRVANYVPHRTLARSTASTVSSEDAYQLTFDSTTLPTGLQTDRLIADGAAWVTGRVGTLSSSLNDMASVVVSLYCAAAIERSWPNDDQSLQRANDIERRMDAMLTNLVGANEAASGTGEYGLDVVYPRWSFPPADTRYDSSCFW